MKMYVLKSKDGKYVRPSKYVGDKVFDRPWEAKLFRRKCDASNSANARGCGETVVTVEVRVKEDTK